MRGQARRANMVGIPGSSKGCTTCKRRKVRVRDLDPNLLHVLQDIALKMGYISAISRPRTALAVPTPEGSARDMSKIGDTGLLRRPSNRLWIPVSSFNLMVSMPLTIRSYLSSGRGTFPRPTKACLMVHPAAGFSKSYLPLALRTQTPCSCRLRL